MIFELMDTKAIDLCPFEILGFKSVKNLPSVNLKRSRHDQIVLRNSLN